MKTKNMNFNPGDAVVIAKTAYGAYQGYKKGGVVGAIAGGYKAYTEAKGGH